MRVFFNKVKIIIIVRVMVEVVMIGELDDIEVELFVVIWMVVKKSKVNFRF